MKKLIAVATMIAIVSGALYAQSAPTGWWLASPEAQATAGRFRSDADNFLRPDAFTNVNFNTFFAMTSFANTPGTAQMGFATTFGNIYTAFAYSGSFWQNALTFTYREERMLWTTDNYRTVPVFTTLPAFPLAAPNNNFHLLVGLPEMNMGFRLSFRSTLRSFSESDFVGPGGVRYTSYERSLGQLAPHIAWSMTENLTDRGIRPYAMITLRFNRDNTSQETIINMDGDRSGTIVLNSQNNFNPEFEIGLGGFNLFENEAGFRLSADFSYNLQLTSHNNEFSFLNEDGLSQTASISGINDTGTLSKRSGNAHVITPSLAGEWGGGEENITLRFQLRLPISINNTSVSAMALSSDDDEAFAGRIVRDGTSSDATTLGFQPGLSLAAQWTIIPRLTLNAGGSITVANLGRTTTEGSTYTDGERDEYSSFTSRTRIRGTTFNTLTCGVTFRATDNITFEATSGILATNRVSVFADTGLFSFTNILVSLRF